jgi:seryl-tRNA synthetase
MAEVASLKDAIRAAEEAEKAAGKALEDALAKVPNVPLNDVPVGDESANQEVRSWGEPREMVSPKEHFELGEALGLMDFVAAARISGSRFCGADGRLGTHGAGARPVHARPAYAGARLSGGATADFGE